MDIVYENKILPINRMFGSMLGRTVHMHKELEVIYVRHGKAVAYADKNSYLLNSGDMFITFPNQIHYYETLKNGEFIVLIFSPNILHEISSEVSKSIPDTNFFPAGNREIEEIFDKIYTVSGEYADVAMSGYIHLLMSMILPQVTLKTVAAEKNSAFYSVIDYCTHNFREDISLDTVAERLHLSKYYISHLINKKIHQNFNEYINNLRIGEACNLLKETDLKIADISENIGFGTIRSFNRSFKQVMGVSPAEYRTNISELKKTV